jgi:Ion channel
MSRKFFTIFENHKQPLVSKGVFAKRVARCVWVAFLLLAVTILMGVGVYHYVEKLSWINSFMNSIMVMTGLGLVDTLQTNTAKIFTCFYAIITAVVFYMVLAIIFAPLIHRFLHEFHLEIGREGENS